MNLMRFFRMMLLGSVMFSTGEISGRVHDNWTAYVVIGLGEVIFVLLALRWFPELKR